MDKETSNGFPILEPLARSGQDGALGGLAFSCDATLDRFAFSVPDRIVEHLEKTSRLEGVDVSSVLLSAFALVLHRYTGGLLEGWIRVDAPQTLGDLARHLSNDPSYRFDGEYFSKLFCVHDFPRDLGAPTIPECRILFVCDPWELESPQANVEGQNAPCSPSRESNDATHDFSLRLFAQRKSESALQVKGSLVYRTQWWRHDRIERFVGHFLTLLSQATKDPDTILAKLPILKTREQRQLLVEFNNTACEYPRELCVHELFEQQVERTPDAVAVVFEDRQLSYSELNARSNRLARHLRKYGVGDQTPVGLCLERSLDLVVSILGILKAGGTYVPLDADYPNQRTVHMLQCAQVCILLTQRSFADSIPYAAKRLLIEDVAEFQNPQETGLLPSNLSSQSTAYVIFTSGSTGVPKGVAVTHANAVNLLSWAGTILFKAGTDCLLGVAPATFDISIAEFLAPLMVGGTTILVGRQTTKDPIALISEIARQKHCVVQATPATWSSILECNWNAQGCNTAISTGEYLPPSVRTRLIELGLRVLDLYGPTETTIWSTYREVIEGEEVSSIGRPISNTQVYVLDSHRELLPIGVPGELYIGGDGLARGYMNRPDLTAERFVPNPFSNDSDSKLYRTGDLCRWRDDGTLEYLGRIDHQVKLRGFRIELGEIEAVLSQHPSIAQCVVILREDRPGDKRLVAYYTQRGEQTPSVLELRESLGSRLPEYMVPAAYVRLDALPLTPSGKIDRRGLPLPDIKDVGVQDQYIPALNGIEEQLAHIWSEVLGIERIGIHDNFFALGGHSLLAARLIVMVRDRLGKDLSFKTFFGNPTIAQTGQVLSELNLPIPAGSQWNDRCDSSLDWTKDRIPASYAQRSLYLIEQMFAVQAAYNIPVAWQIDGELNTDALEDSLLKLVQKHEPLRTVFRQDAQGIWQEIRHVDNVSLQLVDLTDIPGDQRLEKALEWIKTQSLIKIDLQRDLAMRSALIELSESSHILFLVFHHIAMDGLSLENFKHELGEAYDQVQREASRPVSPTVQEVSFVHYRDYTRLQHRYCVSDSLENDRQFWKHQLVGSQDLEIPTDFRRPGEFTFRGDCVEVELSTEQFERIDQFCKQHGCTPHVLLLSFFQLFSALQSGQTDITTAVPIGSRDDATWDRAIGYFINVVAVRSQIDRTVSLAAHVQNVQSTSAMAFDHRHVPFELIVSDVCQEATRDRNPLVQSLFQLIDFDSQELKLDSANVTQIELPLIGARFDLEMILERKLDPDSGKPFIQGHLYYCTDLWDKSTVTLWAKRFTGLVDRLIDHPLAPLSSVELITPEELSELNQLETPKAVPSYLVKTANELFQDQVVETPTSIAVRDADRDFTYQQLQDRAIQIATRLREQGLEIGSSVAVLLNRSFDSIASLFGIWIAGGVYLPLDPSYPRERLKYFLQDAQAQFLLVEPELIGTIEFSDEKTLVLDPSQELVTREIIRRHAFAPGSIDDQAYLLYTSGSTGEPKGVQMPHRAIANLIAWQNTQERLRVPARTLQFAPKCFDVSIQEISSTLTSGGTLVLIDEKQRLDPHALMEFIQVNRVQRVFLPFVMIDAIVGLAKPADASPLEDIVSAGESLKLTEPLRDFLQAHPQCRLHNHYGPTETHVVTETMVSLSDFDAAAEASIGSPIPNCECLILDQNARRVPRGAIGELYLTGACLASGYVGKENLTSERFVALPDLGSPHLRYYRTGDLARWRYDGKLDFLGRADTQVKHRGFRIELGEIESVLSQHPSIGQCVVILREDRPGDKRLVAYYTQRGEQTPSVLELRESLGSRLPEYMVPAAYVRLDALPLTPSGKIDRRGLPLPDIKDVGVQDQYIPARNGIEEQLAHIWSEVLGIQRIGIHDNFFALGGHSLLAVRLTSRISEIFEISLGVRLIFEQPTIAQLSEQIEAKRVGGSKHGLLPLRSVFRNPDEPAPVSYAQERLWFLEQLEGSLTAYNIPMVWRFRGPLDNEALRKAVEAIVARHEPLRTVFVHHENTPAQMVRGLERFELNTQDLQGLSPEDQKLNVSQICRAEADCPFDLTCDLMIRAKLLRLDDQDHQLLVTMHHIASDGWSMDVFTKELSALYGHYLDASTETSGIIPLDPLPVTYIDYSAWQKETLSADRIEGLLSYWRQELKGLPALEFPTDRPRPVMASYRGSSVPIELNESLTRRLESLAQSQQVTLQMLLLAAYEVLLYRYSHQEDFAVGIPFAGRNDTQLENLIGFFVSTLVIRADLTGEPTFQELLSRVRQKSLAAYDHQELPFQVLLADLQPERHLSRPPLFQVMFQLLTQDTSGLNLQGLEVIEEYYSTERVKFDLEMHLSPHQGRIEGDLAYSSDLFDPSTIERMAAQYVRLLESIVAQPNQKIGQFSILTDQERDRLLIEFNDTACEYPRELCVHELFEQQVERTPDAVAVVFEDRQLSYSELNARSNRLARHLRKYGVGDQTPVGLCLERSLDLVVSILGILKAGGTYVPLDADYPVKRLENMLELAQVEHLVTQSQLHAKLPRSKRQVIWVDRDANAIANEDSTNLNLAHDSHRLAYIMFTSGSTGEPKAIMIEHRSIVRLVSHVQYARFGSDRVFVLLASVSFDASTFELWGAFLHGARLVIPPQGLHDAKLLKQLIEGHRVTTLWLTSSLFNQIVDQDPKALLGLDELLIGGEALSVTHVKKAIKALNDTATIINGYGPTESTTFACCFRIPFTLPLDIGSIPIGRPISNTQVYVLDSHRELLPIGVPGELYIGGDGLARGYMNRPDLTAERFVPNPFSNDSDSKLYRTGDLCRWRDDGTLEYLGRIDHQVKLRGFRIELGEIEAVLSQHPSIAQCVVILREDRPGDKRLVAYYTQRGEQTPSVLELRESLGSRLPEYMVPAAYVRLDALPLTPSGKIDRRGLPLPDIKDVGVQDQYTPARNGIEKQLAQIWSEVLGIERIGIHDNFFALGGHSLLAVRLFSEINNRLGHELPLSILFQQGTISQIAQMINESPKDQPIARIVQLSDSKEGPALVVMPGLNGELLYSKKLVSRIEQSHNVVGLQPNLDPRFLETYADFSRTASEYRRIIRVHQPQGPYRLLGYSYGGILGFEIARQLEEQGQAVDFCGVIDTGIEPDLSYRQLGSVAVHLARVSINLPRWIAASCGPNHFRKTVARANRKLRYFGRTLLAQGKTKYTFDDEFGTKKSQDDRRKVLGCLFESFTDYKPNNYRSRVTLFRAATRPSYHHLSPDLGWSRIAAHVDVHRVPGDHETILHTAPIEGISRIIRESVEGLTNNDHA